MVDGAVASGAAMANGKQGAAGTALSGSGAGQFALANRPGLVVYLQRGDSAQVLGEGDTVAAGNRLQIQYASGGKRFGFLFSVDGSGVLTRHLPLSGNMAAALELGRPVLLDYSYELDAAPKGESFYFLASDTLFSVAEVIAQCKAQGVAQGLWLDLGGADHVQYRLALVKRGGV